MEKDEEKNGCIFDEAATGEDGSPGWGYRKGPHCMYSVQIPAAAYFVFYI